uniref:Nucleoplasmin-3 n=1 Tax=Dromaius novaehollandiae TaxID=8790 RepID=A0A8C4K989_DRONO
GHCCAAEPPATRGPARLPTACAPIPGCLQPGAPRPAQHGTRVLKKRSSATPGGFFAPGFRSLPRRAEGRSGAGKRACPGRRGPGPVPPLPSQPPRLVRRGSGCELTGSTKSYTFKVDEEDDSNHILALSVVCLTDGAKDECNVVEVVGRNHENQEIAVPVANLRLSCQPLLSLDNFQLQPPVTFRLAAGSGPVHLAGWHQITHREDSSFEEEEEDMSDEEIAPVMPAKKQRGKQ